MIPTNYYYLAISLAVLILPLLMSFDRRVAFYKKFPRLFISILITGIIFLIWDYYFTLQGIWGFNEEFLTGKYLGTLPLEEILFFIAVPYACVFIYETIKVYSGGKLFIRSRFLTFLFMLTSWVVSYEYSSQAYTSTVFSFLGFLFFLNLISDRKFLMNFYISFLVMALPLFALNLVLTGTGLSKPIIWYNAYEHLGMKLLSVPLENIFFGITLILMNLTIYESFEEEG